MYELEGSAPSEARKPAPAATGPQVAGTRSAGDERAPDLVAAYTDGRFVMVTAPPWWREEEFFSSVSLVTSFEIGPLRNGVIGRQAPEGITVCLVGNDERQDVRMLWCPTEADYAAFLCGPGAVFAQTCATILAADPLKRGSWK